MDDLISRKRALEEMTFSSGIEQDGVLYVPLRDVDNHLKSLPSVQPEILAYGSGELKVQPEADEWCTTCKEYDHEKHCCPRFNKVIRETVKEIKPERKKGQWIIKDNPGTGWYRVTCSECGEYVTSTIPVIGFFPDAKPIWNFCPDCGADMRGEKDEYQ